MPNIDEELIKAAITGNLEELKKLIEQGANVNTKDEDGWTPLHHAASGGHLDIVKYLVKHGADVNVKNKNGNTPLCLAIENCNVDVFKYLLEHGADVESCNLNNLCDEIKKSLKVRERGKPQSVVAPIKNPALPRHARPTTNVHIKFYSVVDKDEVYEDAIKGIINEIKGRFKGIEGFISITFIRITPDIINMVLNALNMPENQVSQNLVYLVRNLKQDNIKALPALIINGKKIYEGSLPPLDTFRLTLTNEIIAALRLPQQPTRPVIGTAKINIMFYLVTGKDDAYEHTIKSIITELNEKLKESGKSIYATFIRIKPEAVNAVLNALNIPENQLPQSLAYLVTIMKRDGVKALPALIVNGKKIYEGTLPPPDIVRETLTNEIIKALKAN